MILIRARSAVSAKALPLLTGGVTGAALGLVPNCGKPSVVLHSLVEKDARKSAYVAAGKYIEGVWRLEMV